MRKIPTLFLRDEQDRRYVTREVNPDAAWVLDGEGRATRKFDGTCTMLDDYGQWWARREVKPGKPFPDGYVPEEIDETTGKTVGWEPIEQSPFVKAWADAIANVPDLSRMRPGTYELCGPKVNGNPEGFDQHWLVRHGKVTYDDLPTDYGSIDKFLKSILGIEGIVWHHPDGRMAKLKRRDFPKGGAA